MRKYRLTEEESEVIKSFKNLSIPFDFKSGEYHGYLLYFEFIDFEICNILLKGNSIDKKIYELAVIPDIAYEPQIDTERLDENSLEYYNKFLQVLEITKKYYNAK